MNADSLALLMRSVADCGLALLPEQVAAFARLGDELLAWNRRINLTAITRQDEIVIKHFLDSLTLVPLLRGTETVLDIGSGAGFPAIPLKIALPELTVVTVDSVLKKVHFQRHISRVLGLKGITALHARVEDLHESHPRHFQVVMSRAFASLESFATLAAPLLAPEGIILAMKGAEGEKEVDAAASCLERLGLSVVRTTNCSLPGDAGRRVIITLKFI